MTPEELHKLKILIVDNNIFIAKTLFSILEAFDIGKVVVCETLEDAQKSLDSVTYDCVFIDFMIENRTGLEFIKRTREGTSVKNDQTLPIILNTGVTDVETIMLARDAGVTEVISKPFSPDQVLMKLTNAIKNPREFIDVEEYIGPNRRRRHMSNVDWTGENDRRRTIEE